MFKKNFIDLCNQIGKSPSFVCREVGITPATFSGWDETSIPRKATLYRISEYFGVTVEDLLREDAEVEDNEPNVFWERFTDCCRKIGKSPDEVGADLGYSKSTVNGWSNGSMPKWGKLYNIAGYFGVTILSLISPEENPPNPQIAVDASKTPLDAFEAAYLQIFRDTTDEGRQEMFFAAKTIQKQIEEKNNSKPNSSLA